MHSCWLCGFKEFDYVFSLGKLPLGFPVIAASSAGLDIWKENLALRICKQCSLIQTVHTIPDEKLAAENLYLSDSSKLVNEHDKKFVDEIISLLKLKESDKIMEIGCGDGGLLRMFIDRGFKNVTGVEPSTHQQKEYPFQVIKEFFSNDVVKNIVEKKDEPDLVIANYVLDVVSDINDFLANLHNVMKKDSHAVLEVSYFCDVFQSSRIDQFAHLRRIWFSVRSLDYALRKNNLRIIDINHDERYRGGTLRVMVGKGQSEEKNDMLGKLIRNEENQLNQDEFKLFRVKLKKNRDLIRRRISNIIKKGYIVYGYGGGLKSSTLVNWLKLSSEQIMMTVDMDPSKQGKVMPLVNIPVKNVKELFENNGKKIAVINLAIDHVEEIEAFLEENLWKGSMIIHLLPEFKLKNI